mmetsp:Transcript_43220/g.69914  ORF Transcript_43220/g.69914 Transcript_43220/m.69914 type:complete len:90 (+) Transcript_43220:307-576(+)
MDPAKTPKAMIGSGITKGTRKVSTATVSSFAIMFPNRQKLRESLRWQQAIPARKLADDHQYTGHQTLVVARETSHQASLHIPAINCLQE